MVPISPPERGATPSSKDLPACAFSLSRLSLICRTERHALPPAATSPPLPPPLSPGWPSPEGRAGPPSLDISPPSMPLGAGRTCVCCCKTHLLTKSSFSLRESFSTSNRLKSFETTRLWRRTLDRAPNSLLGAPRCLAGRANSTLFWVPRRPPLGPAAPPGPNLRTGPRPVTTLGARAGRNPQKGAPEVLQQQERSQTMPPKAKLPHRCGELTTLGQSLNLGTEVF